MKERYRVKAHVYVENQIAEVNVIVDSLEEAKKIADDIGVSIFVETEHTNKIVYDAVLEFKKGE